EVQLPQGFFQCSGQRLQAGLDAAGEVDAKCPPAAVSQHVEIAARLSRLDDTERVLGTGDRQVGRIAAGDLQEYAAVRSALIGLAGRVQEARTETEAGRQLLLVAHHVPQRLHRLDVRRGAIDIGEHRDI